MSNKVVIYNDLIANLISAAITTLPGKAYGLIGGKDLYHPTSMYMCNTNLRNIDPYWIRRMASFGKFYEDPDRGFVIAPEEVLEFYMTMETKSETIVGVFHSHRVFVPGEPTKIDRCLHLQCQPGTLAYLLGLLEPTRPTLRVFEIISEEEHKELEFELVV